MSVCLVAFVCLSVCLFVRLFLCLFVACCLFVCLSLSCVCAFWGLPVRAVSVCSRVSSFACVIAWLFACLFGCGLA